MWEMLDDASVIFCIAVMFGAAFGPDIAQFLSFAATAVLDDILVRIRRAADAAPRDSFPGLSHTAEKERE